MDANYATFDGILPLGVVRIGDRLDVTGLDN